jgi:hypothetical protein
LAIDIIAVIPLTLLLPIYSNRPTTERSLLNSVSISSTAILFLSCGLSFSLSLRLELSLFIVPFPRFSLNLSVFLFLTICVVVASVQMGQELSSFFITSSRLTYSSVTQCDHEVYSNEPQNCSRQMVRTDFLVLLVSSTLKLTCYFLSPTARPTAEMRSL